MNMRDAARVLPKILPDGMKVCLHCWKERSGEKQPHNRYILTEVGGVQFGNSVEMGATGDEDRLSILDEPSRVTLWDQYVGTPAAFVPAGRPQEFLGGARRTER
jgi:hypothetical protein